MDKKPVKGRKKSTHISQQEPISVDNNTFSNSEPCNNNITMTIEDDSIPSKKRGRKPKGGKLISKSLDKMDDPAPSVNIILHLKCSMQDLNDHNSTITQMVTEPLTYNPAVPPSIMTYNTNEQFSIYDNVTTITTVKDIAYSDSTVFQNTNAICQLCNSTMTSDDDSDINIKDINAKLKALKVHLYKNTLDKKSACFWCTYDYDNPACYIPKYESDKDIHGYGSFCRPECAVAYLMQENIDDSTKFERYHLLNRIYSKVYDFKKNIKPAPNPYYLLDKFYGNLSIQEYRKLLKSEHMLLIIDKPMTRILPELHEDNEDFMTNIYGGKTSNATTTKQTGVYKVKRESEKQKGPTKNSIMREKFGMSA